MPLLKSLPMGIGLAFHLGVLGLLQGSTYAQQTPTATEEIQVSDRAKELHRRSYVWDGHNDLPWAIRDKAARRFDEIDIRQPQPTLHTDIDRLRRGNVGAQFWSVFVPVDTIAAGTAFRTTVEQIDLVKAMVNKYPDTFELARTAEDVERIQREGKVASLIGMEGGHSIENSIQNLRRLADMGAQYMTLTHSDTLDWADAATDVAKSDGLSPFGEEIVLEMNRLGMLVDISHVSPATMEDVLRVSRSPVLFSHSSSKAIADHPRNVPDEILRQLPANGGVVMVNFFSGFVVPESARTMADMFHVRRSLKKEFANDAEQFTRKMAEWENAHPIARGSAQDVMDHIDHIVKVAGIDHVGLGSDYDGIGKTPVGLEDVSTYPVLTELMLRRGYSEEAIDKVLSKNMLRVFRKSLEVKKQLAAGTK